MKKYFNYNTNDVSRLSWKNSVNAKESESVDSNRLKNDIFIQKKSVHSLKKKLNSNDLVIKDNLNQNVNNVNNLLNLNSEKTRYNNMTQEIINKDEEIQKYKNDIYQLQLEINDLQKEKTEFTTSQVEIKLLKEKLHEQYNLNKEISTLHHDLKRATIQIKGQNETITMLKNMIQKLRLDKYGPEDLVPEEEEEPDDDEYLLSNEEFEAQKKYFHNDKLKKTIMKYNKQYSSRMVDELFIEMEIKPNIKITKDLISTIINYLKEE